jgi:hypothetical protein
LAHGACPDYLYTLRPQHFLYFNPLPHPELSPAVLATMETKFALMAGQLRAIPCNWDIGILKCLPDQMASHNCEARIFKKFAPHLE